MFNLFFYVLAARFVNIMMVQNSLDNFCFVRFVCNHPSVYTVGGFNKITVRIENVQVLYWKKWMCIEFFINNLIKNE